MRTQALYYDLALVFSRFSGMLLCRYALLTCSALRSASCSSARAAATHASSCESWLSKPHFSANATRGSFTDCIVLRLVFGICLSFRALDVVNINCPACTTGTAQEIYYFGYCTKVYNCMLECSHSCLMADFHRLYRYQEQSLCLQRSPIHSGCVIANLRLQALPVRCSN